MAAAPVELWSTRLSCPQLHRRISSLPQQLPSATLGEPENPSLNSDPGCIKVVDTYRDRNRPTRRASHFSSCIQGAVRTCNKAERGETVTSREPSPASAEGTVTFAGDLTVKRLG